MADPRSGPPLRDPLYAVGERSGATLTGDLDLVAQGDLTMGGRTRPDGTVAYTDLDHTYANDFPGATLTPENPLAGIDQLARQVRESGITRLDGDVIVDSRLFLPDPVLDPTPTPLIINDNLIDLMTTPGDKAGADARLDWRPKVAPYQVTSTVKTVAAGKPTAVTVTATDGGTRIRLSGTIAADSEPLLRTSPITDPAAFGRTALIEALGRAGVRVTADPAGPNPVARLPRDYAGRPRVAAYTSPPYAQYAKLILKVSHNLGANLGICLMAVTTGSHQCEDGFPVLADFLDRAGVDRKQAQLMDGRGGNPADRATPGRWCRCWRTGSAPPTRGPSGRPCRSWASTGCWPTTAAAAPRAGRCSPRPARPSEATPSTTGWPSAPSRSPATWTRAAAATTPSTRASPAPPRRPPTPPGY